MRKRLAVATAHDLANLVEDDLPFVAACAELGLECVPAVWDKELDWSQFSGVLVRSVWGYYLQLDRFVAWLDQLQQREIPVWNSQQLLRGNLDKRYLRDFHARGIPIVPTHFIEPGTDRDRALTEIRELSWTELVVKPAVSAGGDQTVAFSRAELQAHAPLISQILKERALLVQPLLTEILTEGEYSLIFFDGVFSHAVCKLPRAGEFRVQSKHGGQHAEVLVTPELQAQAEAVLHALPTTPMYARVDGVVRNGTLLLMELELIEPALFLSDSDGAAQRFAAAVNRAVNQ